MQAVSAKPDTQFLYRTTQKPHVILSKRSEAAKSKNLYFYALHDRKGMSF